MARAGGFPLRIVFFSFLFITHLLASLPVFPALARQWIWIFGLLGSFLWMRQKGKPVPGPGAKEKPLESRPIPAGAWVLVLGAGLLLRSFRSWAFPPWPLLDEASTVQAALGLNRQWSWRFFYFDGQDPPLLVWVTSLLWKATGSLFPALLIPPFLVASLTLLLVSGFSRRFLPPTPGFLFTAFFALGYWPVFHQGLALTNILPPLWEMGVLILAATALEKGWGQGEQRWFLFLGAWTGLGYWTYTSWPVVAAGSLGALWLALRKRGWNQRMPLAWGTGFAATWFYFWIAAAQSGGYGTHLAGYSAFHGFVSVRTVLISSLDYLNCLFWGYHSQGIYAPFGGGFLNPLAAACFWMGVGEVWESRASRPWRGGLAGLFLLFLLPGLLSQNLECFRIIQLMIPCLGLAGWGAARLVAELPSRGRGVVLAAALALSFGWDGARWRETLAPWVESTGQIRLVYGVLEKVARDRGPGILLTQFKDPNHPEQGLTVHPEESLAGAVFAFNAGENPRLDFHQARWAALLLDPDAVPFLQGFFPGVQWWRPPLMAGGDDRLAVGLIPITAREGGRLEKWVEADRWLQVGREEMLNVANSKTGEEALQYWRNPPSLMAEDPFLQDGYWEPLSGFYYYKGFESNYGLQVEALRNAVTRGYPFPHLEYDLGCLLLRKGFYPEARKYLEAALRQDPGNRDFQYALQVLDQESKGSRGKNGF